MTLDRLHIVTAFVWLMVGEGFGSYIGGSDLMQFANTHAHMNLLGFVVPAMFGVFYKTWPTLSDTRLGHLQYGLYNAGAVTLVTGKYLLDDGGEHNLLAPIGSVMVMLATLLMAWIFLTRSAPQATQVQPGLPLRP